MRNCIIVAALCAMTLTATEHAQQPNSMAVRRLDPALDALIAPDAKLELAKTGFSFTEGAV